MRRSKEEILAGVLKACAIDSLSLSQLMLVQNLTSKSLKSCLGRLVSVGLVRYEERGRRKLVKTTQLGIAALNCYRNAIAFLNSGVAPCPLAAGATGKKDVFDTVTMTREQCNGSVAQSLVSHIFKIWRAPNAFFVEN